MLINVMIIVDKCGCLDVNKHQVYGFSLCIRHFSLTLWIGVVFVTNNRYQPKKTKVILYFLFVS